MDDEGETTEEDSTGNKQEMKPEEQQVISSPTSLLSSQNSIKKVTENIDLENIEIGDGNIEMKKIDSIKKKDGDESIIIMKHDVTKMNIPPPHFPRSSCKSRNRDSRRCQKHFREMIELHSIKNEKLEEREGNLRQRLEILECSMPAVMIWNIWRMSQNAEIPNMKQLIAKQFENLHTKCPKTTNSQHYDCRVRQIEAERKCAQRRINEARALWSEKEFALGEQKRKLEEAKKTQDEHRERIEKLKAEVQELRVQKAREKDADGDSCQTGECGEIKCKQWLGNVSSTTSVKSTDLECLTRIQDLAEAELCMKRNISELERREEAYMRTLQQADELWSKMETDVATTTSTLQEQLQLKASANQQLANRVCCLEDTIERLNKKLANCNQILKKEQIQRRDKIVGEDNCNADVESKFSLARISTCDQYTSSRELQQSKTNCNKGQSTRKIGTSSKISGITCRDEMLDKCLSSRKINQRDQTTLDKCKSLRDIATDCRGERLERSVSTRKIDTSSKDQMTMQKSSSKKIGTSRDKLTKCTSVNTMTRCASANTMTKCSSANAVTKCASASTMKKCASATTMTKCPSANKMAKCTSTNKMSDCTSVNKKTSSKEIPFSCRDERLPKCVSVKKVNIASKDQVKDRDEDQDYHSFDTSDSEGEPCAADFICNDQVFSPTGIDDDDDDEFQSTTSEMILKDDKEDKKNKKDDKANDDLNRTLVAKESFTQLSKPVPKDEDQIPLEVICTGGINKTDETNIESVEQISNIQESEDGESKKVPRAEERKTDQKLKHDDVAVPKAELKSWLQSTADFEKAIANCSKCSPNANDVKKLANSIRTYLQIPLEDVTEYERIKTVEILSETLNMQKTAENIEENLKHTEEQQSNKEPKLAEETEPDKEIEISEEPLTIIYDKKFRISNGKLEETVENIENEEKLSKEIEKSEKIALDEEIKEDIEEVYDQKSQKSDNENETQKKVEQSVKDTSPTEKLEEPLAKIDSLSALRNSVEKIEKKDVEYHQQLVTDEEKTERTNDKTELFSDGEKETDRKKEKEENLVSTDKSLHDEEEEMEHSSKDKEVLSESIENEDKLSNAGENDEFTEKPIIPDEKDKEEEKEEEENEEKEKKEDEKEQEEKIEEEPKKAITREKSQIMTESGPSIPEEAKLVIVKGAVTSSTGIIVEKPVKEDLEKELSLQTQKIGSEENAFKKIAKTDSDCICKPEQL
ncbi:FK506-binding protein 5-like [Leptopilina heterotoma]|uniref:FK506-binding protein 5-like n=1 Tax=Leptopilina heterotoma TaxID=63436 RepID=UPI001CAA0140|nr:FK506-binding protein 5-like [Leptopilina heterotoma]